MILWALRWYLAFPISYRDLAAMLSDRGVSVDHTTLYRWVQAYAATLEQRVLAGGPDLGSVTEVSGHLALF